MRNPQMPFTHHELRITHDFYMLSAGPDAVKAKVRGGAARLTA
jgi:hypothetical protein